MLQEQKAIRIVYDEAHQILTAQEYRNQFEQLQQLAIFPIAKLAITASLPKRLEKQFLTALGLPLSTPILRAPSDQPHISYHRLRYSTMNTTPLRLAIQVAKLLEQEMEADQIGIIFCTTKAEVDALYSFTKCSSYSDLPDKHHNEEAWKQGHYKWIAATTGLIQGIDSPKVGATIFFGLPYGLLNLYQGSGRGGRDGRKSWSVTLVRSNNIVPLGHLKAKEDLTCEVEADRWAYVQECRRFGFSNLLDKSQTTCQNLAGCHLCDYCNPECDLAIALQAAIIDPPIVKVSGKTISSPDAMDIEDNPAFAAMDLAFNWDAVPQSLLGPPLQQDFKSAIPTHLALPNSGTGSLQVQRDAIFYRRQITSKAAKAPIINNFANLLNNNCVICWANNPTRINPKHNKTLWIGCSDTKKSFIPHMFGWMDFKKQIKFPPYQYCFRCQLPQDLTFLPACHPQFGKAKEASAVCPLDDVVILLIWYIRHTPAWWSKALQAFPDLQSNMGENTFAQWVNAGESAKTFYNGLELVLWFYLIHSSSKDIISH